MQAQPMIVCFLVALLLSDVGCEPTNNTLTSTSTSPGDGQYWMFGPPS